MPLQNFLDVDRSLVGRNLRITDNAEDEELTQLFRPPTEDCPSRLVKPAPGFCIKTKEIGTGTKLFVNVCKTEAIPAPKDITEAQLESILESEEVSSFRVPMSIGEPRNDADKKGEQVRVVDIAINTKFHEKVENSRLFKNFVMEVIFQGLSEKHGIVADDERMLMKNRKVFGTLQVHRIQQRDEMEKAKGTSKTLIEVLDNKQYEYKTPEYRLYKRGDDGDHLYAEVKLPNVISSKELTLDLGEDRIIVEAKGKSYLLDIFVPLYILQEKSICAFNTETKILTIKMPLQDA